MVFQGINNHPSTARTSSKLLLPGTAGAQQGGQIVNGMQRPIRPGTGPAGNSWSGLRLLDNMGNIGKAGVTYSNLFHVYVHYIYIYIFDTLQNPFVHIYIFLTRCNKYPQNHIHHIDDFSPRIDDVSQLSSQKWNYCVHQFSN